jgi:hypothetical protein
MKSKLINVDKRERAMSDTILVKTKPCCVCGEYEVWSLDRKAVMSLARGREHPTGIP